LKYVLITIFGGIIDLVTFYGAASISMAIFAKYLKGINRIKIVKLKTLNIL
jgi:hypothetical protein